MNICANKLGNTKWNGRTIALFCYLIFLLKTNQTTYLVKGKDVCFCTFQLTFDEDEGKRKIVFISSFLKENKKCVVLDYSKHVGDRRVVLV